MAHVIRLRAPWRRETTPEGVQLRRGFNSPTGLDRTVRVWIVVEGLPCAGTAIFNGQAVGQLSPQAANEFDVTDGLALRNEVCLDFMGDKAAAIVELEGVRIEIRPA